MMCACLLVVRYVGRNFEGVRQSLLLLCDDLVSRPESAREAVVLVQSHCIALHQLFEKLRHRQALERIVEVQRESVARKRALVKRLKVRCFPVFSDGGLFGRSFYCLPHTTLCGGACVEARVVLMIDVCVCPAQAAIGNASAAETASGATATRDFD